MMASDLWLLVVCLNSSNRAPGWALGGLVFEQCSLLLLNYARPECMERILAENVHLPWGDILIMDSWHLAEDNYPFQWPSDPRIRRIGMDELLGQYPRACGAMLTKS